MGNKYFIGAALIACVTWMPAYAQTDIATVRIDNRTVGAKTNIPVTFGQAFKPGDVPNGQPLAARRSAANGSTLLPIQQDIKTRHPDDSLKFAVLTFILPTLADGGSEMLTLVTHNEGPAGSPVNSLPGGFDATVNAGANSASAAVLVHPVNSPKWLEGPLVTEWLVDAPLTTHLHARFEVRVYNSDAGNRVRISVTVENTWAPVTSPGTQTYNASITSGSASLSQNNVPHYRQSRWRRILWFNNNDPGIHIAHDSSYLMEARLVPTYDDRVNISGSTPGNILDDFEDNGGNSLMGIGDLDNSMPNGGGRGEIAPLPHFTAIYLMTQHQHAKDAMLGYGRQAGTWPIHYRDPATNLPISLATYPNISILGSSPNPSTCETCGSPYTPDVAHQPSFAYVPYLVTGDYYFLEELQFWANYNMFYWGSHGGAQGLVVFNQMRGQAWGMRTLAQAAWATPDTHPMKSYFETRLANNIDYYIDNQMTGGSPLGFMTRRDSPGSSIVNQISTWQDDFMTWALGHVAGLGYSDAIPLLQWKVNFPVGRMTHPDYCWVLASSSWPWITTTSNPNLVNVLTSPNPWAALKNNVVWGWTQGIQPNSTDGGGYPNYSGDEQAILNEACGSSQMFTLLGISNNRMIGYQSYQGYPANLQPALATAIDVGATNAEQAWSQYIASASFSVSNFSNNPQWAIVPSGEFDIVPVPPPPPGSSSSSSSSSTTSSSGGGSGSSSSGGSNGSDDAQISSEGGGSLHPLLLLWMLAIVFVACRRSR